MFQPEAAEQVGGDAAAIFGTGAPVAERLEILRHGPFAAALKLSAAKGWPVRAALGRGGAFGDPGHAAKGDAGLGDDIAFDAQAEGRGDGGDIAVAAFRDLVGGDQGARLSRE